MNYSQIIIPFLLTLIAGLSTVAGSLIFLSHKLADKKNLNFFLGVSAGVMIYLSFVELIPYSVKQTGFVLTNILFFCGIAIIAIIDFLLPHNYLEERISQKQTVYDSKLLSTGTIVAIGLMIHNFPEGMAVFISSLVNIKHGLLLAIAIAIHNIPEGIAVATPIYHATHDKKKAIKYALISGMAEPVGAIIAYLLLRPYLSQSIVAYVFAIVAGIMTYISFDELLPACFHEDSGHRAIIGIFTGMLVVFISIALI